MSKILYLFYIILSAFSLNKETNVDEVFEMAFDKVDIPEEIYNDINLQTNLEIEGYDVSYFYISDYTLIDNEGKVTRKLYDTKTSVKVIVRINNNFQSRTYDTVVKGSEKVKIVSDNRDLYVGDILEVDVNGKYDRSYYKWKISDEEIAELDEDFLLYFSKIGEVTISICDKYDYVLDSITLDIRKYNPILRIDKKNYIIGEEFSIKVFNYSEGLFDVILSDTNVISYEDGTFKALNPGFCEVTYVLKEDNRSSSSVSINVYDITPEVVLAEDTIVCQSSTKISILNYSDESKYVIEVDENYAKVKNNFIYGLKAGVTNIKVSLASDSSIFSTVALKITNIMPKVLPLSNVISPNGKTYLTIENISSLVVQDINDFIFESKDKEIATIERNMVIGKKIGKAVITCQSQTYNELKGQVEITIKEQSNTKLPNGEVGEGPLVVTLAGELENYKVGEMVQVNVLGAKDLSNYRFSSSDSSVLNVLDNGNVIVKKEGRALISVSNKERPDLKGEIYITTKGYIDVDYIERLLETADKELGYRELSDKTTKYGTWYGIPDGDWCAMFVTWCAHYAGISTDVIPFYCNCQAGWTWFMNNNCYGLKEEYIPKRGDIIFFLSDGASHTGIVTDCKNGIVYTIEGNTSDMVAYRSYSLNNSRITGYGIPNYDAMKSN